MKKNKILRRILSLILIVFPFKKVRDFIMWPISNNLFSKDYIEEIKLKNGLKITVYQDVYDYTNKSIMFRGEYFNLPWEPTTSQIFIDKIKNKKNILIAGGHLGYYALLASKFNPDSKIYVFEPNKKMYTRLKKNVEINNIKNIQSENLAISNKSGTTTIVIDDAQSSLVKHPGNQNKKIEEVEMVTIDDFFKTKEYPDFALLDVEGYEVYALQGAKNMLSKGADMIIEVNEKMLKKAGSSQEQLIELLTNNDYQIKKIDDKTEAQEEFYNILALKNE